MENNNLNIVIISGAGLSQPALDVYRSDNNPNALWNLNDFYELAHPNGWSKNRARVNEFYNYRRQKNKEAEPTNAHYAITKLQEFFSNTYHVTQNVDSLAEKAGNVNLYHVHGELMKIRDEVTQNEFYWEDDWHDHMRTPDNGTGRPAVVWFTETTRHMKESKELCKEADLILVIGTSLNVAPCSNLVFGSPRSKIKLFNTEYNNFYSKEQQYIGPADETVTKYVDELIAQYS